MPSLPPLEKLAVKPDHRVYIVNAPSGADEPPNAVKKIDLSDIAVFYAIKQAQLPKYEATLVNLPPEAKLWVCFPKQGKLDTDLSRDKLWMFMKERGFTPEKMLSVDDTWSAFSFKR
jgi:hypothetical protein